MIALARSASRMRVQEWRRHSWCAWFSFAVWLQHPLGCRPRRVEVNGDAASASALGLTGHLASPPPCDLSAVWGAAHEGSASSGFWFMLGVPWGIRCQRCCAEAFSGFFDGLDFAALERALDGDAVVVDAGDALTGLVIAVEAREAPAPGQSISGSLASISTTSGCSCSARAIPCLPVVVSPATSISSASSTRNARTPRINTA
jgi:hypothetical protein